jgi:hypothetical protein
MDLSARPHARRSEAQSTSDKLDEHDRYSERHNKADRYPAYNIPQCSIEAHGGCASTLSVRVVLQSSLDVRVSTRASVPRTTVLGY